MSTAAYARSATATSPSTGYSVTACTMPRRASCTERVGHHVARLLGAFGCQVLASDPVVDEQLVAVGIDYVPRDELLRRSDIIALTCPLTSETFHLVDEASVATMKDGVMIVNTGRGALVDTSAVISGLKSGRIGSLGLDVYEEEAPLFFEDRSTEVITDDVFARLADVPQRAAHRPPGVLPRPALRAIAETTLSNLDELDAGGECSNRVDSATAANSASLRAAHRPDRNDRRRGDRQSDPHAGGDAPRGPDHQRVDLELLDLRRRSDGAATRATTSTTASTGSGGRPR